MLIFYSFDKKKFRIFQGLIQGLLSNFSNKFKGLDIGSQEVQGHTLVQQALLVVMTLLFSNSLFLIPRQLSKKKCWHILLPCTLYNQNTISKAKMTLLPAELSKDHHLSTISKNL